MESLTLRPFRLPLNLRRPSHSLSTVRFRPISVKATSSSQNPTSKKPISILIKTSCAAIAAAAFFLTRFNHRSAAIASPAISSPESIVTVESLRSEMEAKIKANKIEEALEILDRLIALEPDEPEWPLLRANIHSFIGSHDVAQAEFEDMLLQDPHRVEAYHGLVMAASESGNFRKISETMERAERAMSQCSDKSEVRDFKLLMAQVKVMEKKYDEALGLYKELVKEEPRDFRPYLCQGIIYSLLQNQTEAEKNFDTFRRLVPKNHPYREYFEDNMFATKLYSQAQKESHISS